jgi:hypothetical protein
MIEEHEGESLREFNDRYKNDQMAVIRNDVFPEPYIGDLKKAPIILLALSASFREEDLKWHSKPQFAELWIDNLLQRSTEFPFYPLNPALKESPTSKWWRQIFSQLLRLYGDEQVAKKISVLQWFPYHQVRSRHREYFVRAPLPSQRFMFQLAADALKGAAEGSRLVIMFGGSQARDTWAESLKQVEASVDHAIRLKNVQRPFVSRNNMSSEAWERLHSLIA